MNQEVKLEIRGRGLSLAISAVIHTALLAALGLAHNAGKSPLMAEPGGSYKVALVSNNLPPSIKGGDVQPASVKIPLNPPLPKVDFKGPVEKAPLEETEVKTAAISGVDVQPQPEPQPNESRDAPPGRLYNNEDTIPGKSEARQPASLHEKGDSTAGRVGGGEAVDVEFGSTSGPAFLKMVRPSYPRLARRLGREGEVVLRLSIDEHGRLLNVEIVERAGHGFDEAAVDAVRASSFKPASINGAPVGSTVLLPIIFKLE